MRAQSPRTSSTVSGSPGSACVTCSARSAASARSRARRLEGRVDVVVPPLQAFQRLGRERREVAQRGEARERLALELPDALARQVELVADRLERPRLALEAEPQLQDAPLALGQR